MPRLDYQGTDEEKTRKDMLVEQFLALSPLDVGNFIDSRITVQNSAAVNIAVIKTILKIYGAVLLMIAKKLLS